MRFYSVHLPSTAQTAKDMADRAIFVRDGFAWWALFFPLFWLLWHRMWIVLALYIAVSIGLGLVSESIPFSTEIVLGAGLLVNFIIAFEGNDLRRWTLSRKGVRQVAIVQGRKLEDAEARFFEIAARNTESPRAVSPPPKASPAPESNRPGLKLGDEHVVGLFPQAERLT